MIEHINKKCWISCGRSRELL